MRAANSGQKASRNLNNVWRRQWALSLRFTRPPRGRIRWRSGQRLDSLAHIRANSIPVNCLSLVHPASQGLPISPGLRELVVSRVLEDPLER